MQSWGPWSTQNITSHNQYLYKLEHTSIKRYTPNLIQDTAYLNQYKSCVFVRYLSISMCDTLICIVEVNNSDAKRHNKDFGHVEMTMCFLREEEVVTKQDVPSAHKLDPSKVPRAHGDRYISIEMVLYDSSMSEALQKTRQVCHVMLGQDGHGLPHLIIPAPPLPTYHCHSICAIFQRRQRALSTKCTIVLMIFYKKIRVGSHSLEDRVFKGIALSRLQNTVVQPQLLMTKNIDATTKLGL